MDTSIKIIGYKRRDDGEIFSINDDGTFSSEVMKKDFPNNLHRKYYAAQLGDRRLFTPIVKTA